ncbi:MAG: hypothetical protein ACREVO_16570 [Steroidobacteraceae bacterium]
MEPIAHAPARRAALPVILIAAVIQGWSLYALHRAIEAHHWQATHLDWLLGLYAVALLVPTTVELMATYAERTSLWILSALLGCVLFYFGWHHGDAVADLAVQDFALRGDFFPIAIVLLVWWLLTVPFLQSRVATGLWRVDYQRLFSFAWHNAITLAEAAFFTGLFWLILFLWQSLFSMLQIDFFQTLFSKPLFAYPVTAIVFGCALHLIGSIDALVSAVLEQLLNVLKWLATVAGALLILFTLALLTKLPGLVASGRHAIDAEWLLWLVAVIVLFLNAAYRDGTVTRPYPRWVSQALRFAVPLTIVITQTALYALIVRSRHYGLTVPRVWGFIVAAAAVVYSVGYSIAAFRRGPWLSMASRVNVMAAVALIVVIGAALTPLLSPYRLAALSQYQLIVDGRYVALAQNRGESPFTYLALDSGKYGRNELQRLRTLQGPPDAGQIRDLAARALQQRSRWEPLPTPGSAEIVAKVPLYPAGRTLDPALSHRLAEDWSRFRPWVTAQNVAETTAGVFVDLDGDGSEEFVLFSLGGGPVYQNRDGHWVYVGTLRPDGRTTSWRALQKALADGKVTPVVPLWKELSIGPDRYSVAPSLDFAIKIGPRGGVLGEVQQ